MSKLACWNLDALNRRLKPQAGLAESVRGDRVTLSADLKLEGLPHRTRRLDRLAERDTRQRHLGRFEGERDCAF